MQLLQIQRLAKYDHGIPGLHMDVLNKQNIKINQIAKHVGHHITMKSITLKLANQTGSFVKEPQFKKKNKPKGL